MISKRTSTALSTLLVLLLLGTATPAKAQLGINGGLNFSSVDDIDADDRSGTLDNSTGYHLGLVYNMGLGPVDIRPAFVYRRIGEYELGASSLPGQARYTVSAWEVPIDVKFTLPLPVISPYVLAGPMVTIPRGEDEFDDALEEVSYTLNVGVGGSISVGSATLEPELRYEFGATKYIKDDFTIGDTEFQPRESPKYSAISLRLNILL